MANNAPGIGDLGDIACAITFVGAATVPNLIVQPGTKLIQCVHSILAVFSSTASYLLSKLVLSLW